MPLSSELQLFARNDAAALVIAAALGITFPLAECRAQAGSNVPQPGAAVGDTEAAKRAAELFDFQLAQKLDSKEGWETFLRDHPSGVSAVWAKQRLTEIEKGARPPGVAPSGGEHASTSPGGPSRPIGHISIHVDFLTHKENLHTRNDKTIDTKVEDKVGSLDYSITMDSEVLSVTEKSPGGGAVIFRCGLNKSITTPVPVSEPLNTLNHICSYSNLRQVYSINWSFEGGNEKLPRFDPGLLQGAGALTISLAEDRCQLVEAKGRSHSTTYGHPNRFTNDRSSSFKSGSCVAD